MFPRSSYRALSAACGVALCSLVLALPAGAAPPPGSPQAAAQQAGVSGAFFNRETYQYTTRLSTSQEANQYQVMVMQATNAAQIPALHAANPNLKILLYQDILISNPHDPTGLSTCTPYPTADPAWFLKDHHGRPVINHNYAGDYLMDVADPAYQQACAAHAAALAHQDGFDGIFMDDVTAWIGWDLAHNTKIPAYPTRTAWQTAMGSMVNYFGPAMHTQGLLALANIGGSTITPGLWDRWIAPLDGAEEESFSDGGLGTHQQAPFMTAKLANVATAENTGKLSQTGIHGDWVSRF